VQEETDKDYIDDDFLTLHKQLEIKLNEGQRRYIHLNDTKKMWYFLSKAKPVSKQKMPKTKLILYLQENNENISKIAGSRFRAYKVYNHLTYVSEHLSSYGFSEKLIWLPIILVILLLEILVIIFLIRDLFYYIPVVSLLCAAKCQYNDVKLVNRTSF